MLDKQEKIIGLVENKIQVVISQPNISDFSKNLKKTMEIFSETSECFIVTSSEEELTNKIIEQYELSKSFISLDFKNFATLFNLYNKENELQKSLMIIDKSCQIVHKDIL
jgi:hypothetical protein